MPKRARIGLKKPKPLSMHISEQEMQYYHVSHAGVSIRVSTMLDIIARPLPRPSFDSMSLMYGSNARPATITSMETLLNIELT